MPADRETRIIVLHLTKYGDHSLVVQALDAERGRTGFFLRGAGKGRGGLNHFHSLGILDVVAASNKGDLEYIKEFENPHRLEAIRTDPYKSAIALFIGELLYRSLLDGAMDSDLFEFLEGQILALNTEEGSVANFHICFLVDFCRVLGLQPKDNYSPATPLFTPYSAEFTTPDTLAETFTPESSLLLHQLLSIPREEAMQIPLSRDQRGDFAQKMVGYLSYHLSQNLNIRSLKVLHDLFS
ncbi:MAG: DNA repair protein RecO C-terminal domain-containing protein [Bacteroidales bacterium]|nr:DNA repair protein RecO C-terminal domain-containing protein [Bacteroidales bacterium]